MANRCERDIALSRFQHRSLLKPQDVMNKKFFYTKIYPWLPYLPWEGPPVPKIIFGEFLAGLFGDLSMLAWKTKVEKYK